MARCRTPTTANEAVALRKSAERLSAAAKSLPERTVAPTLGQLGLEEVALPRQVLEAAAEVLRHQASGEEPKIVVLRETLSAQQAADLLGVSRPHLNMLLDRERIPYTTTPGRHRRIRRADIETYRSRQQKASCLMNESMAHAEQLQTAR